MAERKRGFNEEILRLGHEAYKYEGLFNVLVNLFPEGSDCNYVVGTVTTLINKDNPTKGDVDIAVRVGRLSTDTGKETTLIVELGVNLGPGNFNPIKEINLAPPSTVTKKAMLKVNRNPTLNTIFRSIQECGQKGFTPVSSKLQQ